MVALGHQCKLGAWQGLPLCWQGRQHLRALVVVNRPRTIIGLGHVPASWRPCLVSLLEVPTGLEPQPGLLGGASKLRAVQVRRSLGQMGLGTME